jgi:hypothetical protein
VILPIFGSVVSDSLATTAPMIMPTAVGMPASEMICNAAPPIDDHELSIIDMSEFVAVVIAANEIKPRPRLANIRPGAISRSETSDDIKPFILFP